MLALVVILWNAVTHDCRGGLETSVTYEVLVYEARVTGTMVDGFGNIVPVYSRLQQRPVTAETFMSVQEPSPPALGEVTYIGDPVALDGGKNRSDQPCQ